MTGTRKESAIASASYRSSDTITFSATGDSFITRRLPNRDSREVKEVSALIQQGDFRFTNLEVTIHDHEAFPAAVSGGTWAAASPRVLQDLNQYGFNAVAWANNHTMDSAYDGLSLTEQYLNQNGFIHAGVGANLAEASSPRYVETPNGRVSFIAVTSTFNETWAAGEQRPDMKGRPGINPLRYETKYTVTNEHFEQLKEIAAATGINSDFNLLLKEGFAVASGERSFRFGDAVFEAGTVEGTAGGVAEGKMTRPDPRDSRRIMKAITEARRQADYVILSIHSHEMAGEDKKAPAAFLKAFARKCIDQGAHAVIGHGPHVLRGVEIYKDRPIFYSLGNFIFQNETVAKLPQDFYEKYGLGSEHQVAEALDIRSDYGKKGLAANPDVWVSVIPLWQMRDGKLTEMKLYPIELGFELPRYRQGWPRLSQDTAILEALQRLSEPFGTQIEIKGTVGFVK